MWLKQRLSLSRRKKKRKNAEAALRTSAASSATKLFSHLSVRILLIVGITEFPTQLSLETKININEAREELENQVETVVKTKGRQKSDLLYHYTQKSKADNIVRTQSIIASSKFPNPPDNKKRPAGAYATVIEPWNPSISMFELKAAIYANRKP